MLSIQQNQPNLSFKAGLNKGVVRSQHTFDCKNAEKFLNTQGIVSNFQKDPFLEGSLKKLLQCVPID